MWPVSERSQSGQSIAQRLLLLLLFIVGCAPELDAERSLGANTFALTTLRQVNAGGPSLGVFTADASFSGGSSYTTSQAVVTTGVPDAAPAAVYQSERVGTNISYTFSALTPGSPYVVRLHFAEIWYTTTGSRLFNVNLNGTTVLSNFDTAAAAGGAFRGVMRELTTNANAAGQVSVALVAVKDNAKISGLELLSATSSSPPSSITLTPASFTLAPRAALQMSAVVKDASGVALSPQPVISWTASGGATISASGGVTAGATAGGPFTITATSSGLKATASFSIAGAAAAPGYRIASGGPAVGAFQNDAFFTGGTVYTSPRAVSIAGINNVAPAALYQSERVGTFTYTLPALLPSTAYTVRLHFAEIWYTAAGARVFNVNINGRRVLSDFDVAAQAGGAFKAVVRDVNAVTSTSGQLVIAFAPTRDGAKVSGIEVLGGGAIPSTELAVSPKSSDLLTSGQQSFSCSLGDVATSCDWRVQETGGGTVDGSGLYTAPSVAGTYHIVATSRSDSTKTSTAIAVVAAPPSSGDCTGLGSVGTWQDITPTAFRTPANMETFAVTVDPLRPNVVFAAAGNNTAPGCNGCSQKSTGVYMSTNCGETFAPLSMGPNNEFASGVLWHIRVDPTNSNIMYTMSGYGAPPVLYKSIDAGRSWRSLFTGSQFTTPKSQGGLFEYGGFVRSFDLEATNPAHIAVAFHESCYGQVAAQATEVDATGGVMCLAESRDGGSTWSIFEGPIGAEYGDGGAPIVLSSNALFYAGPGGTNGAVGWYTDDPSRAKSSWRTVLTYDRFGVSEAVNQSGAYRDSVGGLYLPGGNAIAYTAPGPTFGQVWSILAGSPSSHIVIGDGRSAANGGRLFASRRIPGTVQGVYSAPMSSPQTFQPMSLPANFNGVSGMAYDPVRHVLYGAAGGQGLWRVVTY